MELQIHDITLLDPDLAIPVPEVAAGVPDRLGHRALTPEAQPHQGKHLRLLHQVPLNSPAMQGAEGRGQVPRRQSGGLGDARAFLHLLLIRTK